MSMRCVVLLHGGCQYWVSTSRQSVIKLPSQWQTCSNGSLTFNADSYTCTHSWAFHRSTRDLLAHSWIIIVAFYRKTPRSPPKCEFKYLPFSPKHKCVEMSTIFESSMILQARYSSIEVTLYHERTPFKNQIVFLQLVCKFLLLIHTNIKYYQVSEPCSSRWRVLDLICRNVIPFIGIGHLNKFTACSRFQSAGVHIGEQSQPVRCDRNLYNSSLIKHPSYH